MQTVAALIETGMPSNKGLSRPKNADMQNPDVRFSEILAEQDNAETEADLEEQELREASVSGQSASADDHSLELSGAVSITENDNVPAMGPKEAPIVPGEAPADINSANPVISPDPEKFEDSGLKHNQNGRSMVPELPHDSVALRADQNQPNTVAPIHQDKAAPTHTVRTGQAVLDGAQTSQPVAAVPVATSRRSIEQNSLNLERSASAIAGAPAMARYPTATGQFTQIEPGPRDPVNDPKASDLSMPKASGFQNETRELWTVGSKSKPTTHTPIFLQEAPDFAVRDVHGAIEAASGIKPELPATHQLASGEMRTFAPRELPAQIVQLVRAQPEGKVELQLHPEELGRVRISFGTAETGTTLTVNVSADRQETLDLMRRHLQELHTEMKRQGFHDVSFSFGNQSKHSQEPSRSPVAEPGATRSDGEPDVVSAEPHKGPSRQTVTPDHVDIRI